MADVVQCCVIKLVDSRQVSYAIMAVMAGRLRRVFRKSTNIEIWSAISFKDDISDRAG